MTLEEAIYELNDLEAGDIEVGRDKAAKAERLGIEALSIIVAFRADMEPDLLEPLPGETKE